MAIPSFLNTGFAFTTLPGTTVDVQDIINAVDTMLLTTLSATPTAVFPSGERWTSLGGGVYKSPLDTAGRFMTVKLTRTTITRLGWEVSDPTGVLFTVEIDIAGAGSACNIYGGPGHLVVEANNAGAWEVARAIMVDPTPEPLGAFPVYVWGTGRRTSAGVLIGSADQWKFWCGRYYGGTVVSAAGTPVNTIEGPPCCIAINNANMKMRTEAGSDVAFPYFMSPDSAAGSNLPLNGGRLYQTITVDFDYGAGTDATVPIDTGVTGVFRVTRMTSVAPRTFAIRKA